MFYLILFVIFLGFAILEGLHLTKRSHNFLVILEAIILICVAGFRFQTGGDWDVYEKIFEYINPISQVLKTGDWGISGLEIGYVFLNSVIKECGGTIQGVFFIISLCNIILLVFSLNKYTQRSLLALFIYYAVFYFSLEMLYTRQSVAIILFFVAIQYIEERKLGKFLVLLLIAISFHRMSIVMLPCYLLIRKTIPLKAWLITIGLGCLLMFLGVRWFSVFYLEVSKLLGAGFYTKALAYTTIGQFAVSRGISIGFLLNLFLFLLFLWKKEDIEKQKYGTIFFNLFNGSLIVYYYCYEIIEVSNRFRFFFFIGLIVLFPLLLDSLRISANKLIIGFAIICYSFFYNQAIFIGKPSAIAYHPYQNYWIYKWTKDKGTGEKRLEESIKQTKEHRRKMKK